MIKGYDLPDLAAHTRVKVEGEGWVSAVTEILEAPIIWRQVVQLLEIGKLKEKLNLEFELSYLEFQILGVCIF